MKDSWLCRDYRTGDEHQILSLYRQVTGREMSLDFWKWRYAENPFGKAVIKLMFDGDMLIAHNPAIPMPVLVQGIPVPAAILLNTLTHPDYRGLGISTYQHAVLYKEAAQRGIQFIYNFPNPAGYALCLKLEDWQVVDQISVYQKRLKTEPSRRTLKYSGICQVEEFDEQVDSFWDRVKGNYRVIVPRVGEFLNWRFVRNPAVEYAKYLFTSSQNEVLGYMVLKIYSGKGETKGNIVDILSVDDEVILEEFLECAYDYFSRNKIQNVSSWAPEHSPWADLLRRKGFFKESTETHFGLRILDKQNSLLKEVEHIENWYLTMGDSDVF